MDSSRTWLYSTAKAMGCRENFRMDWKIQAHEQRLRISLKHEQNDDLPFHDKDDVKPLCKNYLNFTTPSYTLSIINSSVTSKRVTRKYFLREILIRWYSTIATLDIPLFQGGFRKGRAHLLRFAPKG